ncbi:MAG: amidohydrolase family protein [Gemmatimonadota bacterium]
MTEPGCNASPEYRGRALRCVPRLFAAVLAMVCLSVPRQASAQRTVVTGSIRQFVSVDTAVIAFVNARVIDGTGAPAREGLTVVVRDGRITALGDRASTPAPAGALVIDLTGRTLIPGLVMVHEHLYYPAGAGTYGNFSESFVRLYLAGGVTMMRTGGNMNGFAELNMKRAVDEGTRAGPWIDATAPYLNGPNNFQQMHALRTPEEARRFVNYWADAGATSFKAYMQIRRDVLRAAIDEVHRRGLKVTGHLCSVTYREAAEMGIDNLEHGFIASTDFVAGKTPDECPGQGRGQQTVADLDPAGSEARALIADLVRRNVALTSTLTVFETFTPGRPKPPGTEVLAPQLREEFDRRHSATSASTTSIYTRLFPKAMALEKAFADAGGLLIVGTDPTGGGGVIPGFSNQRAVELLVEAGFSPVQAIRIATLNGATYLGKAATTGSIAVGKNADLVVVRGNPAQNIGEIRNVEVVFRGGVGFDPAKLIASVTGRVGLW